MRGFSGIPSKYRRVSREVETEWLDWLGERHKAIVVQKNPRCSKPQSGHRDSFTQKWARQPAEQRRWRRQCGFLSGNSRRKATFYGGIKFTSRAFSLVVNQVIFVALAYNLLQLYLKRQGRAELNRRTLPRVYNQLLPNASLIIIYCQNRFALFTTPEYTKILLTRSKNIQDKILHKTLRLEREMVNELNSPRPP